jgi:hypothetical protein
MRPTPDRCSFCFGTGNHAPDFDCRPKDDQEPARHVLKTWPGPFVAMREGKKTFEFRKDDRGYRVGDMLVLREWTPDSQSYLGPEMVRWVTYIARGPAFGIPDGYCIMSVSEARR